MATTLRPKPVKVASPSLSPETSDYSARPKLGAIHMDFKLYIEGVEVPFESITISSTYGALPVASVTVPYLPFLQEMARNYPAKVHIFFKDVISDRTLGSTVRNRDKHIFRLLFSGVIKGAYYQKSKGVGGASTNISFQCVHKNYVASEILIGFASFNLSDISNANFDASNTATSKTALWNPTIAAQQAMQGVDISGTKVFNPSLIQQADESDTVGIPGQLIPYAKQFAGIPGVILRLWNILCKDSFQFAYVMDHMKKIYIPLMYNIKYFEGMAGHPIVENHLQKNKLPATKALTGTDTVGSSYLNPIGGYETGVDVTSLGAASIDATLTAVAMGLNQFNGNTPLPEMIGGLAGTVLYDVVTLNSPVMRVSVKEDVAEVEGASVGFLSQQEDPVAPIETIVHPNMNLYFAPACNVIYPNMYRHISVNDLYDDAPTRITSRSPAIGGDSNEITTSFRYRSPYNVREASYKRSVYGASSPGADIINSVQIYEETPASHEMGRGIRPQIGTLPAWTQYISAKVEREPSANEDKTTDWRKMLMDYNDYLYSVALSSYRTGQVSCVFNPYIIVGYPMDIVDPSPLRPSHHAFCTSVVHSISSSGVTTEIGFSNAITFEELYVYDTPTTLPWIADLLGIRRTGNKDSFTSIVNVDDAARSAANTYYEEVLGVGAAFVDELSEYKYSDGVPPRGAKSINKVMSTIEDAIAATRRSVQTMASVEALFDFKFINTIGTSANQQGLREFIFSSKNPQYQFNTDKVRPGHNMFLDYSGYVVKPESSRPYSDKQMFDLTGSTSTAAVDNKVDTQVNSKTDWDVRDDWVNPLLQLKSKHPDHYNMIMRLESELLTNPYYKAGAWIKILHLESGFNPDAHNPVGGGAYGYGQIQNQWNGRFFGKKVKDYTPIENLKVSQTLFKSVLGTFKNVNDAVVSYNQGSPQVLAARRANGGVALYSLCKLDMGGAVYFNKIFTPPKGGQ